MKSLMWIMALSLVLAGCAAANYQPPPERFTGHRFWYEPTAGRVGYHMVVSRFMPMYKGTTSVSRGCYNGDISDAGVPGAVCMTDLIVRGSLPPGLDFIACFENEIAGTPTAPGVWEAVIRQTPFYCPEGVTPPHDVTVRFVIEGTAPKGVR